MLDQQKQNDNSMTEELLTENAPKDGCPDESTPETNSMKDDTQPEAADATESEPVDASAESEAASEIEETATEPEADAWDEEEDDPDNLASVAERITGARHSVAATAAPIRIRDVTGKIPTVPKATAGIPVRDTDKAAESTPVDPEAEAAAQAEANEKEAKNQRTFRVVIASAVALIVILSTLVVALSVAHAKEQPADMHFDEPIPEHLQVLTPENTPSTTPIIPAETPNGTDTPVETNGTLADTAVPETTPPETEPPAPVKFTVTLDFYDREDITVSTEAITLGELLTQANCILTEADIPSIALDAVIATDTTVTIDKREYRTEVINEDIPYQTEVIKLDTIPRDTTNYLQAGENGVLSKTYTVEYRNGVEVNRTLASEETTKWPVTERYELGVGGSFVGADGVTYTYSHRRVVPATYYNIEGLTYLGTMADESVVAVDMDYIPLGTKLYVKNDKFDFGVRIASDIGGMVDNWEVDIWIDKNNPQLPAFAQIGYHYDMEIYYID